MKLVAFDMDGVIFGHTNFWLELHKALGTYEEGKKLTDQYAKKDYARLVDEVVGRLWKGKKADRYFALVEAQQYVPGARETFASLRKRGIETALISSGPSHLAKRAKKELRIDYAFYNELVIRNNVITGEFIWPVGYGTKEKAIILERLITKLGIGWKEVAFVGDHDNDAGVCKKVGLGIAFCPTSVKFEDACDVVVRDRDLRCILAYF